MNVCQGESHRLVHRGKVSSHNRNNLPLLALLASSDCFLLNLEDIHLLFLGENETLWLKSFHKHDKQSLQHGNPTSVSKTKQKTAQYLVNIFTYKDFLMFYFLKQSDYFFSCI